MIKGIIFDMDGVLCDSEAFICEAAIRFLNEAYGVEAQSDEFLPFVGMGEDRYLGGVAEAHGITLSLVEDKIRLYTIYLEIIKGRMLPVDGVYAFIKGARASGKKLAVATSADLMKMEGNLKELGRYPRPLNNRVTPMMDRIDYENLVSSTVKSLGRNLHGGNTLYRPDPGRVAEQRGGT